MGAGIDRKTAERKRKALERKHGKPYVILRASNGETAIVSQEYLDNSLGNVGRAVAVVAYSTDGGIVCPDCLNPAESNGWEQNTSAGIIRSSAEEYAGIEGLRCDRCDTEIVEPTSIEVKATVIVELEPGVSETEFETALDDFLSTLGIVKRAKSIGVEVW